MASLCKNLRSGASHLLVASKRPLQTLPRPHLISQSTPLRAFHNNAPSSSPPPPADFPGDIMETRKASPAHCLVKIDSFSSFDKRGIDKFEAKEFQAGGYNWKLIIYPNGDPQETYGEHVSVKLALADTSALPAEINAVFSVCMFNYEHRCYVYDIGRTTRFHTWTKEFGFPRLISKEYLTDPTSGYLKDDQCVFGAEVFVHENKAVTEYFSKKDAKVPDTRVIKISNFSSVKDGWNSDKTWTSKKFTAGGHTWRISVYPNGKGESKLVTSLHHVASENSNSCETAKANHTVSLRKGASSPQDWFTMSCSDLNLETLENHKKKFDDSVNLEVKIRVEES